MNVYEKIAAQRRKLETAEAQKVLAEQAAQEAAAAPKSENPLLGVLAGDD